MATTATLPPHLSRFGLMGCREGSLWNLIAMESVTTEVMIRGFVAQVCAKLVYLNNTPETLQVQAVFPVDEGAAVYHFEARLADRVIVTHCLEKKEAKKMYKEAIKAGQSAVMARECEDSPDIIKLNLGNLPGESHAEITLKMVMELKVQTDGGISFVLPTVLNPRYCPPGHPLRDTHDQADGLFGSPPSLFGHIVHVAKPYSIEIKATVSGSHKIARIASSTDPINITLADDGLSAQVSQDGGFKGDHDWSFLVYYNNPYTPHLLRETGNRSATGIMKDDLLMLNFFPEIPGNTYSNKNEIIFVIDCSGSMRGDKIKSAKETLLLFLKSLPAGCLFNVVRFGSHFYPLYNEGSRMYTEETLKNACNLQATMDADLGGTQILLPLEHIYSKPPTPGYSRQILLITDGEVWNVDPVLQLVGRQAYETRFFSVGVGHGASTALVRGVARVGQGRSEMVANESLLQQKVMGLVNSMVQESVQEVSIACEVEPASRVTMVPKVPPVIFGGQHLILYARVPATTQVKSVTVRGQLGTKPLLNTVEGQQVTTVHDEAKSLHRLAARAQLLQWQLDEEEDIAEDMIALSTGSGVVCRRTALIGIDKESGKPISDFSLVTDACAYNLAPQLQRSSDCSMGPPMLEKAKATDTAVSQRQNALFREFELQSLSSSEFHFLSMPLPNHASLWEEKMQHTEKSKESSEPEEIRPCSDGVAFGFCDAGRVYEHPSPVEELSSGLMGVVSLQQFDGSWMLEDAAKLIDMSLDVLSASSPAKSEAAWATALVLVLLERKFGEQKEQWALLATKAQTFITGCGEQLEDLVAKARNTLHAK